MPSPWPGFYFRRIIMKWILVTLAVMAITILFMIYRGGGWHWRIFVVSIHFHGGTDPGSPHRSTPAIRA